jgi:hypothetical protein
LADITIPFLDWFCWEVAGEGKKPLIVIGDDASWHTAGAVSLWVRQQNQRAELSHGVNLVIRDRSPDTVMAEQ